MEAPRSSSPPELPAEDSSLAFSEWVDPGADPSGGVELAGSSGSDPTISPTGPDATASLGHTPTPSQAPSESGSESEVVKTPWGSSDKVIANITHEVVAAVGNILIGIVSAIARVIAGLFHVVGAVAAIGGYKSEGIHKAINTRTIDLATALVKQLEIAHETIATYFAAQIQAK